MAYYALVPAAGAGARMGGAQPKQYLPLAGRPLIWHALHVLCATPDIRAVFVVLAPDDTHWPDAAMAALGCKLHVLRCGGDERAHSVRNGLRAMAEQIGNNISDDWVLVHDAARPCLTVALVDKLVREVADDTVGGLLAVPVADTLKRADDAARSVATAPRANLWQAQTPQMFRHGMLLNALNADSALPVTDEAGAIEALGFLPRLVAADISNLKVTYPADLDLAEMILRSREIA
jgi:2-C-methyl-D-erythritol 4-phosphate cytidylyltransferase